MMMQERDTDTKTAERAPLRANRQLMVLMGSQSIGMVARGIYFVTLPLFVLSAPGPLSP